MALDLSLPINYEMENAGTYVSPCHFILSHTYTVNDFKYDATSIAVYRWEGSLSNQVVHVPM